jgi:uncharacterized protein (DUF1697 family)
MAKHMGTEFLTIVRPVEVLREMLASDPFKAFALPADAKRIVTFLRDEPRAKLELPIELGGAQILSIEGRVVFTAYGPNAKGAVFMTLIEKTFGKAVTTRTWDTVAKVAR